jgi:hypothetical protein
VALVRTDVSEERSPSFIRVTRIGEVGITLAVTSNQRTLRRNTSVLTRATRRNIPEDAILHSHRHENLKSYTVTSLFVDDVCTSQETNRSMGITSCYGDSVTFYYVDDIRTSQETHLWVCRSRYRDNFTYFTFYL